MNWTSNLPAGLVCLMTACFQISSPAKTFNFNSPAGVSLSLDDHSGQYTLKARGLGWKFKGNLGCAPSNVVVKDGADTVGDYREISFDWPLAVPAGGSIRVYDNAPAAVFTITCHAATEKLPAEFPDFTSVPIGLHHFSFGENAFAPPKFDLEHNGTPWLLFDDRARAALISPANNLLIASMDGDGIHRIASGLSAKVTGLPPNFSDESLVVFGQGIRSTWKAWSDVFLALQGSPRRPANDADIVLRDLGYWTDNGAYYYYNYDTSLGYAGTLETLVRRYRDEGIPIHYLQLDSWWYEKTFTGPDGKTGRTKNPKLPAGEWNRYGGLLQYKPDPAVLPGGLTGFHDETGLPLVTHNRWVDPASPYRQKYRISGIAAVDPRFWDEIMSSIAADGVVCYEQDWLNEIYSHSPRLQTTPGLADAFADNMARAASKNHLSLQYCMPLPRFFLQGSHYSNLTTIRTSDDRFERRKWDNFLFTSQLARAVGIWPWCDVFMSGETNNLLVSVLSAGPVGTGDAMGRENRENLLHVARADGVLVKPDESLLPADDVYVSQANGQKVPMVAWTYTDHGSLRTAYVFAYVRQKGETAAAFRPAQFGLSGRVCVLNARTGEAHFQPARRAVNVQFGSDGTAYYEVVPAGESGIAFFGDEGKYVSNGRQRIAALQDRKGSLTATVLFAAGEKSVRVFGFAKNAPEVEAQNGSVGALDFDAQNGRFAITVMPAARPVDPDGGQVEATTIIIKVK